MPRARAMNWPTPTTTASSNSWSMWSGQTYRFKIAGSPWHGTRTGYAWGGSVRAHHQRCSRSPSPWARPRVRGNEYLQVTMNGLKSKLSQGGHTTVSTSRVTNFINQTKEKELEIHDILQKGHFARKKKCSFILAGQIPNPSSRLCREFNEEVVLVHSSLAL